MFNRFYSGKKILVTGHTGFKGTWLSHWLLKQGAEICGYSVDIPSQPSLFEASGLKNEMRNIEGDVEDFDHLKNVVSEFKPDLVFHLAAQAYVRKSYDEPVRTFATNLMGTVHILESLKYSPNLASALIVTTDKCYLNSYKTDAFVETDKLGGSDPYSASKAAAEIAFYSYAQSFFKSAQGVRTASARAGNVIGGGDWSEDRLVPDCVKQWAHKKTVELRSPQAIRPWQHVLDSLHGYLKLIEKVSSEPNLNGESFNFGPKESSKKTVLELVSTLKKYWPQAEYRIKETAASEKKESHYLFLNSEKAESKLGWKPIWNFETTVEKTATWYSAYYKNPSSSRDLVHAQLKEFEASVG